MQNQFVSFENFNTQSSAWIPRVFSHLRKKSESIPTDIDSSGLHMLTSFAPWGSEVTKSARKKSKSADSILIEQIPSTFSSPEYSFGLSSQILSLSSSRQSLHARSSSLPATFGESLPKYFSSSQTLERNNEFKGPCVKVGDSHSIIFEGEGFSMFTIYILALELKTCDSGNQKFKIKKRYSEFKDLYNNLLKIYGIKLPAFPHKAFLGTFILLKVRKVFKYSYTI